jgi:hypothetical protein
VSSPIWNQRPDFRYCQTVASLLCGAPSLKSGWGCRLQLLLVPPCPAGHMIILYCFRFATLLVLKDEFLKDKYSLFLLSCSETRSRPSLSLSLQFLSEFGFSSLKMEAIVSSDMLLTICQTTHCYILQEYTLCLTNRDSTSFNFSFD